MADKRFRLAPTPSGFLHKGNAFNFLLNWLYARRVGAQVLLRIDDLDAARSRPEYMEDIFETLQWLGLDWDAGPKNVQDFQQNWSQSLRLPQYQKQLNYLQEKGLVFSCECTRKSLQNAGFNGIYPNICAEKQIPQMENLPWRLRVPKGTIVEIQDQKAGPLTVNLSAVMGSFVIKTREGLSAYQLASLCDDQYFGVTHVIRGQDLLPSTAAQLYLAKLFGFDTFQNIQWFHHPLITDTKGNKLSKSAGSLSLQYLRKNNFQRTDLFREFAHWLGIPLPKKLTKVEMLLPLLPRVFT